MNSNKLNENLYNQQQQVPTTAGSNSSNRVNNNRSVVLLGFEKKNKDSKRFKITEIQQELSKRHDIIILYEDNAVYKCDVYLLFCTHNAKNSKEVDNDISNALVENKHIIAVYESEKDIPATLTQFDKIKFNKSDIPQTVEDISFKITSGN